MPRIIVGAVIVAVCLVAWGLGGKADWPWPWAYLFTVVAFGLALVTQWRTRRTPDTSNKCVAWWVFLPWVGFAIWLTLSYFNPSHMLLQLPNGDEVFYAIEYREWLPSTVDPARTLQHGMRLLSGMGLAWALWGSGATRRDLRMGLWALYINALILGLVGTYFRLTHERLILGEWKSVNSSFFASFRYHNHWGGFCLLMLGVGAALLASYLQRYRRMTHKGNPAIFILGSWPLLALTLTLAGGRGSMIAGAVFAMAWVRGLSTRLIPDRKKGRLAKWGLGLAALAVVAGIVWIAMPVINPRWSDTMSEWNTRFTQGSVNTRWTASRHTFAMFLAKPVCGWGLGSFAHVFPGFAKGFIAGDSWLMEFAHNDWLQFLAELGVVGFALLIVPVIAVPLRLALKQGLALPSRWLLGGLGAVLMLAWMDFPLSNPAVALTFFVILGFAWSYAIAEGKRLSEGKL